LDEIHRRGWKLKSWRTRSGKEHLGQAFDRPALVRLLTNVLYIGEVNHKGTIFPGEQPAIIERKVFDRVTRLLKGSSRGKEARERSQHEAALRGIIHCTVCRSAMVYGFHNKPRPKYPYYICLTAQKRGAKACPGQVITADRIEKSVVLALFASARARSHRASSIRSHLAGRIGRRSVRRNADVWWPAR